MLYIFLIIYFFTKKDIKKLFQAIFNVNIISINTCILPGKIRNLGKFKGIKNSYKRVFVKLLCFLIIFK